MKNDWKDKLNRRYAFKKHMSGRWLYYLVDDDDEETMYGFLDEFIEKVIRLEAGQFFHNLVCKYQTTVTEKLDKTNTITLEIPEKDIKKLKEGKL